MSGAYRLNANMLTQTLIRKDFDMFTPAQACETLTVPASTLRRWAGLFQNYLSPQKGKKRQYTFADIDIFRQVRDLSQQGFTADRIKEQLTLMPKADETEKSIMALTELVRELSIIQADNARLQAQLSEQQKQLDAVMAWLRLPWYKRMTTKQPG